jgi:hypothetical protein
MVRSSNHWNDYPAFPGKFATIIFSFLKFKEFLVALASVSLNPIHPSLTDELGLKKTRYTYWKKPGKQVNSVRQYPLWLRSKELVTFSMTILFLNC